MAKRFVVIPKKHLGTCRSMCYSSNDIVQNSSVERRGHVSRHVDSAHTSEVPGVCESSSKGQQWGNSFPFQLAFQILGWFFFLLVFCMFKLF